MAPGGTDWLGRAGQGNLHVVTSDFDQNDRESVLSTLHGHGRLLAVAELRKRLGCSLGEAVNRLNAMAPSEEPSSEYSSATELVAIGPYATSLVDCLPYRAELYAQVIPGTPVIASVFEVYALSEQLLLVQALGEVHNTSNGCRIDATAADLAALSALTSEEESAAFVRLRDAGFFFYLLKHGKDDPTDGHGG